MFWHEVSDPLRSWLVKTKISSVAYKSDDFGCGDAFGKVDLLS